MENITPRTAFVFVSILAADQISAGEFHTLAAFCAVYRWKLNTIRTKLQNLNCVPQNLVEFPRKINNPGSAGCTLQALLI
jgi:hypothetical protein